MVRTGPDADDVKAFHNVCHHRGRKVKDGSGNARSLMCMYRGWTWSRTGEIEYIPEGGSYSGVMDQDFSNIPHQQTGQKSPAFKGCRLSSIEARCRHMYDVLDRYLDTP